DMAEGSEAAKEAHLALANGARQRPGHRPGLADRLPVFPAAVRILVLGAGEDRVGAIPFLGRKTRRPQRLRLGTDDAIRAVALELSPVAGIDQRVVGPALGLEHD